MVTSMSHGVVAACAPVSRAIPSQDDLFHAQVLVNNIFEQCGQFTATVESADTNLRGAGARKLLKTFMEQRAQLARLAAPMPEPQPESEEELPAISPRVGCSRQAEPEQSWKHSTLRLLLLQANNVMRRRKAMGESSKLATVLFCQLAQSQSGRLRRYPC